MRRIYDWRRIKIHRTYTIDEAAKLLDVQHCTIYRWIKDGLPCHRWPRPVLIKGSDLREWVKRINGSYKCEVGPGRFYCFSCQAARAPAGNKAVYRPFGDKSGLVMGHCEACGTGVNKRVSFDEIAEQMPGVEISFEQPE